MRISLFYAMICLAAGAVGCIPVAVGGQRYAVHTYDRETGEPVTPRVVIAFYDHDDDAVHWGAAVGPAAAQAGIDHPLRIFINTGYLVLIAPPLFYTEHIFAGVCVLSEGHWPSFLTTNLGPDRRDVPESRSPNLFIPGGPSLTGEPEPAPAGCAGAWRVLVVDAAPPYNDLTWSYSLGIPAKLFPTLDAALAASKDLSADDKRWAYGELLKLARNGLQRTENAYYLTALARWIKTFEARIAQYSPQGPGERPR